MSLLPCPFCGSDDVHHQHLAPDDSCVKCRNCGGWGPNYEQFGGGPEAWNKRNGPVAAMPAEAQLDLVVRQLVELMGQASQLVRQLSGTGWLGHLAEENAELVAERQREAASG